MAVKAGWFGMPWLTQKLVIVCAVIIPLEIIDIVVGNWLALKASQKTHLGSALSNREIMWISFYHGILLSWPLCLFHFLSSV